MTEPMEARIRATVEAAVAAQGFDLEELKLSKAGRRTMVRVLVDRDGRPDLDAIAGVSRSISKELDAAEAEAGPFEAESYTLEVSSPGVDRPLTLPRHWRRNAGRLVSVKAGNQTIVARILSADERGVELKSDSGTRVVAYGELGPGRVQLEFSRPSDKDDAATPLRDRESPCHSESAMPSRKDV